ncbi:MAG: hypothetical protein LQ339_002102 [Xanthoria mediterranea]|nr:MAG: hypothetical protein LQ339_002102 [Xanthoria mediterranea]
MRLQSILTVLFSFSLDLCSAHLLRPQANCSSCLPNPIATTYPHNITGTINATTAVLLVPLCYAQSLLPSRFANSILTHAYTRFNIPPTTYPLVVESVIDHDIRYGNIPVAADFSSFRITFPFIDLLGDGYSPFRYTGYIYLPPSNLVAINGSHAYGYTVLPAYFAPPDAPYEFISRNHRDRLFQVFEPPPTTTTTPSHHHHKSSPRSKLLGATKFRSAKTTTAQSTILPLAFYKNVTNQIMFGNNTAVCDRMMSFWNTSITTGAYEPQHVVGEVALGPPLVPRGKVWRNVPGLKADRAFLEVNYLDCEGLKGWRGTGSGDSG